MLQFRIQVSPVHSSFRRAAIGVVVVACAALAAAPSWAGSIQGVPETVIRTMEVRSGQLRNAARDSAVTTVRLPIRAEMVGASWRGTADHIVIRSASASGAWSRWTELHADDGEGPDRGSSEGRAAGSRHRVPTPAWVGSAERIQIKVDAGKQLRDVEIVAMNASGTATLQSRVGSQLRASAGALLAAIVPRAAATLPAPDIRSRAQWGADESIRRAAPEFAPAITATVLHHTVNSNGYTRGQVPAMIRGIYAYHVRSNGWNDIGYNYLVDRFGRVWEGRHGGVTRAVIGAHTGGFNTGTAGIALIGTYDESGPSQAARSAVVKLVSWRLDLEHVSPMSTSRLVSRGNSKWPAGQVVTARNLSGHRDLYETACPGGQAHAGINSIRAAAWKHGGTKFAGVRASSELTPTGEVASHRIRATANRSVAWTITWTRASTGTVLARRSATGTELDLTWNGDGAATVPAWDINWKLEASAPGSAARPLAERLTNLPAPPTMQLAARSTAIATPNGDRRADVAAFTIRLASRASVQARVVAVSAPAVTIRTLPTAVRAAGTFQLRWNGRDSGGDVVPDGSYRIILTAADPVASRPDPTLAVPIGIDSSARLQKLPAGYSPNGDGRGDQVTIRTWVNPIVPSASLRLRRVSDSSIIPLRSGSALHGTVTTQLGATTPDGVTLRDGRYELTLRVPGRPAGTVELRHILVVDRVLRSSQLTRMANGSLRFVLGERMLVRGQLQRPDGSRVWKERWIPAGTSISRAFPGASRFVLADLAGNTRAVRL